MVPPLAIGSTGGHADPTDGLNQVLTKDLGALDGIINGTPPLRDDGQRKRWRDVMTAEYNGLVEASVHGRATLLDQYGATNEGEFFAVAAVGARGVVQ